MTRFGCEECRALAPELALGIASGEERATALRHLAGCADCRRELRQLTETADRILMAVPEAEPSAGFDERVVEGLSTTPSRRWSRRAVVLACAAAVLLTLAAGAAIGWLVSRTDDAPNGTDVAAAGPVRVGSLGLDAPDSRVVVEDGDPSWLLVTVDGGLPDGDYEVVCEYEGGWSRSPGTLTVSDGRGTWAATVSRTLADLEGVKLRDGAGEAVANAWLG
jgi:hypothetical protein